MIISDSMKSCQPTQAIPVCPNTLVLDLNDKDITPGMEITFEVKKSMSVVITIPGERLESGKYQKILTDTFDKHFQRAKRPDWLKDVPGDTYQLKQ